MTDNEIIKTLECCSRDISNCKKCPYLAVNCCTTVRCRDVLALIERQQAEIKQWKETANNYQNLWGATVGDIQNVKFEAIKEFVGSLFRKSQLLASSVYGTPERGVFLKDIDALVIEMKGKEV